MLRFLSYLILLLCCSAPVYGQLKWDQRELEFKPAFGETNVVAHFQFVNAGPEKVTISNVQTSCDCTKAELAKKTYSPGEKGEIVIKFDTTQRFGAQQKQIIVHTDLPKENVYVLTLKVIIPELLSIKPQILLWKKGEEEVPKIVQIKVTQAQPVEITRTSSTIPEFSTELKVIKASAEYELKVTPSTTERILTGRILLETNFKSPTPLNLGVHTLVR